MFAGLPQLAIVVLIGASRIYVNRNNQKTIAKLTEHSTSCEVLRQGEWETLSSEDLVPGDVVKIWDGWVLPCDLAVLQGSCVVNESALTGASLLWPSMLARILRLFNPQCALRAACRCHGFCTAGEATPVQKQSAPKEDAMLSEVYNPSGSGKRYTLFAGTTVLQSCDPGARCDDGKPQETLAVVTSTAINTRCSLDALELQIVAVWVAANLIGYFSVTLQQRRYSFGDPLPLANGFPLRRGACRRLADPRFLRFHAVLGCQLYLCREWATDHLPYNVCIFRWVPERITETEIHDYVPPQWKF